MTGLMTLCTAETEMAGDYWGIVGSTVVTGMVVVFLILAILVGFLTLMGSVLGNIGKKKTENTADAPVPAPAAAAAAVTDEAADDEDDNEVIAVIAAAISAYGQAEGKQYKITSVKKRDRMVRSGWNAAGVSENTRGF